MKIKTGDIRNNRHTKNGQHFANLFPSSTRLHAIINRKRMIENLARYVSSIVTGFYGKKTRKV